MPDPTIGSLRWLVWLVRRRQTAQAGATGIDEIYELLAMVRADIQPIRPMTYWAAQQVDTPVTHLVRLRWVPALDNTTAVLRKTTLRDSSKRAEVFRVRRMKEVAGRKRFVEIEAELEHLE